MSGKIEISRELLEQVADALDSSSFDVNEEVADQLRALLAAPVAERQEPVAYVLHKNGEVDWDQEVVISNTGGDEPDERFKWLPVFASPPAPVAVVLPERLKGFPAEHARRSFYEGWNACLDKVKELNQ